LSFLSLLSFPSLTGDFDFSASSFLPKMLKILSPALEIKLFLVGSSLFSGDSLFFLPFSLFEIPELP